MGFKSSFGNWARRFAFELGIINFVFVAILFVVTGISLKERIQWVDHTYQVLADLFDLSSHLERAETTQHRKKLHQKFSPIKIKKKGRSLRSAFLECSDELFD